MPRCYVRCRCGRRNLVSRSCLTSPCCPTGGVVFLWVGVTFDGIWPCCGGILPLPCRCGILPCFWRYPASPLSLHARRGLVVVSFFAAAVSCLTLVVAVSLFAAAVFCLALVVAVSFPTCGGILSRPYLCTPGVVLLRYPSSLQRYPASPLSLRYPSSLRWYPASPLSFVGSYRCLVTAPVHGCREVGLSREIIDCVEKNIQTSYRALPLYFSFPLWNYSSPARLTQFLRSSS